MKFFNSPLIIAKDTFAFAIIKISSTVTHSKHYKNILGGLLLYKNAKDTFPEEMTIVKNELGK